VEFGVDEVMANSGQTCSALTRMLIPESRYEEAIEIAQKFAESICVGDPTDPKSEVGPMCSEAQRKSVIEYIQKGIDEGARLVTGGTERPLGLETGAYVRPTIFADVTNDMVIAREEIFGPVASVIPFDGLDQAIDIANDSIYGLAAGVWTQSIRRAITMSERLQAGTIWVNTYRAVSYMSPFGGYNRSGLGRESGQDAIYEYLQTKSVWLNFAEEAPNPFVIG